MYLLSFLLRPNKTILYFWASSIFCSNNPAINLQANYSGGIWTGDFIDSSGTFDPSTATLGYHQIIYTIIGICEDADTIIIEIRDCSLWLPNVFSPNNDGLNDYFKVIGIHGELQSFLFTIYDRWGEIVYESEDPNGTGWDGIYKGKPMNSAVFAYRVVGIFMDGHEAVLSGTVTLTR